MTWFYRKAHIMLMVYTDFGGFSVNRQETKRDRVWRGDKIMRSLQDETASNSNRTKENTMANENREYNVERF